MSELKVAFKPLIISINTEREQVYQQLKQQLEQLQLVANDPAVSMKLRLRAAGLIIRVCQALANVLEDMQLEEIEAKIHKLQADVAEEQKRHKAF